MTDATTPETPFTAVDSLRRMQRTLGIAYGASIAALGGSQIFTLLLFAVLQPDQVGLINWATAACTIVFYIGDVGLDTSAVVSAKRLGARLRTIVVVVGSIRILAVVLSLVFWLLIQHLGWVRQREATVLLLVGLSFVMRLLQTPFAAHLQVHDRQAQAAAIGVTTVLIRIAGLPLLWLTGHLTVTSILVLMVIADSATLIALAAAARRVQYGTVAVGALTLARSMWTAAPMIMVSQAALIGQGRIDWLLVAAFASYAALANYSIANKALELMVLSGSVFGRTALPWLVEGWTARNLPRAVQVLSIGLLAAGGGMALLGGPILRILFGSKYVGAIPILPTLAVIAPALALYQVAQFAAFARHRSRDSAASGLLGLTAMIAVDLSSIPTHGILGAAWGMLAFTAVAFPIQVWLGYRAKVIPGRAVLEVLGTGALLPLILVIFSAARSIL